MYIILHRYLNMSDEYIDKIFKLNINNIKYKKGKLYELLKKKNKTIRIEIGKFINNKIILNRGYFIENNIIKKNKNILLYSNRYVSQISDCRNRLIKYFCERNFKKIIFEDNNNLVDNCDLLLVYFLKPIKNFFFNKLNIKYKKCIIIFEDARYIYNSDYDSEIKELCNKNDIILMHTNEYINKKFHELCNQSKIFYYPYVIDKILHINEEKIYDILIYGSMNEWAYPFRVRIRDLILNKMKHLKVKYIKFAGYEIKNNRSLIINNKLHKLISISKLVLCTSSIFNLLLRKYIEVNYSNSIILGNNIDNIFGEDMILNINNKMSDETIINIINNYLDNYKQTKIKKLYNGRLLFNYFYNDIITNNYNIYSNNNHFLNSSFSK